MCWRAGTEQRRPEREKIASMYTSRRMFMVGGGLALGAGLGALFGSVALGAAAGLGLGSILGAIDLFIDARRQA
jgi:hypothetical protein